VPVGSAECRIEPYILLRAEAALLLAEGNKEAALSKAEQGLAIAQRDRFMLGSAIAEHEWLQTLLQKIVESSAP
jgi:hypothetical protein